MVKRARIIYNPTSGRELIQKYLVEILNVYEKYDYETSTFSTTPEPLSALTEARRCGEEGFDLIVAAGGDGTVSEVVSGIAPLEKRPKVAVLPAGTTNDFARALHIPREDIVEAAKLIEKDQSVMMDVGQANFENESKYFINIAAAGSLTELTYEVSSQVKSIFGYLAYFAKGAEKLPNTKPIEIKAIMDGEEFQGKATILFVSLTNSVGGFEKIATDTVYGDGKFTVMILKEAAPVEIIRIIRQTLTSGNHIHHPKIIYKKASELTVSTNESEDISINLDGEYGGNIPVTFKALKQHIEFVADPSHLTLETPSKD